MPDLAPADDRFAAKVVDLLWPVVAAQTATGKRRLVALPNAGRPRLLVPDGRPRVAAAAINRYVVSSGRSQPWVRPLLTGVLFSGLVPPIRRRSRLDGSRAAGITELLRQVLGCDCEVAMFVGPPRGNRKPVLFAYASDARLLAVAKVGLSANTRHLVRNEAAALVTLQSADLPQVDVPQVLFAGEWAGYDVLVQTPLPKPRRASHTFDSQREAAAVEISRACGVKTDRLQSSAVIGRLLERIDSLPEGSVRQLAQQVAANVVQSAGGTRLPIGSWHGDWTPWNMAPAQGKRVIVWDWERFAEGVPVGYDGLHYYAQLAAGDSGGPLHGLLTTRSNLPRILQPFGVPAEAYSLVFALYLLELLVRYTEDNQERLPAGGRWVDAITAYLPTLATELHQASGVSC